MVLGGKGECKFTPKGVSAQLPPLEVLTYTCFYRSQSKKQNP